MYSLPIEVQLDVLKCLNFDQLFSFKQANFYFCNFINKHEKELALMYFGELEIIYNDNYPNPYKIIELKSGIFEFTLKDQLKNKWQDAINVSIPLFLHDFTYGKKYGVCLDKDEKPYYYILELPNFPKNIEEMIIIRCWMEHLFKCSFYHANFRQTTFNPQMIKLLFDNDKTIDLRFHAQDTSLFARYVRFGKILKFTSIHAFSDCLLIDFDRLYFAEHYFDALIKFLMNAGNNFREVFIRNFKNFSVIRLQDLIIKNIKTSRDLSKMVAYIRIEYSLPGIKLDESEKVELKRFYNSKYNESQIANTHIMKHSSHNFKEVTFVKRILTPFSPVNLAGYCFFNRRKK